MSYRYADENRNVLDIATAQHTPHGPRVAVNFEHYDEDSEQWAHLVKFEDAPAVALAILEAAGIEPDNTGRRPEGVALGWLDVWRKTREDKAEREAEDAKVAEFRKASDPGNHFEWHELKPEAHDAWRKRYRAARKFFEES